MLISTVPRAYYSKFVYSAHGFLKTRKAQSTEHRAQKPSAKETRKAQSTEAKCERDAQTYMKDKGISGPINANAPKISNTYSKV